MWGKVRNIVHLQECYFRNSNFDDILVNEHAASYFIPPENLVTRLNSVTEKELITISNCLCPEFLSSTIEDCKKIEKLLKLIEHPIDIVINEKDVSVYSLLFSRMRIVYITVTYLYANSASDELKSSILSKMIKLFDRSLDLLYEALSMPSDDGFYQSLSFEDISFYIKSINNFSALCSSFFYIDSGCVKLMQKHFKQINLQEFIADMDPENFQIIKQSVLKLVQQRVFFVDLLIFKFPYRDSSNSNLEHIPGTYLLLFSLLSLLNSLIDKNSNGFADFTEEELGIIFNFVKLCWEWARLNDSYVKFDILPSFNDDNTFGSLYILSQIIYFSAIIQVKIYASRDVTELPNIVTKLISDIGNFFNNELYKNGTKDEFNDFYQLKVFVEIFQSMLRSLVEIMKFFSYDISIFAQSVCELILNPGKNFYLLFKNCFELRKEIHFFNDEYLLSNMKEKTRCLIMSGSWDEKDLLVQLYCFKSMNEICELLYKLCTLCYANDTELKGDVITTCMIREIQSCVNKNLIEDAGNSVDDFKLLICLHNLTSMTKVFKEDPGKASAILVELDEIFCSPSTNFDAYVLSQMSHILLNVQKIRIYSEVINIFMKINKNISDKLFTRESEGIYTHCKNKFGCVLQQIAKHLEGIELRKQFFEWLLSVLFTQSVTDQMCNNTLTRTCSTKLAQVYLMNFLSPIAIMLEQGISLQFQATQEDRRIFEKKMYRLWATIVIYCFPDTPWGNGQYIEDISKIAANTNSLLTYNPIKVDMAEVEVFSKIMILKKIALIKHVIKDYLFGQEDSQPFFAKFRPLHMVYVLMIAYRERSMITSSTIREPRIFEYLNDPNLKGGKAYVWQSLICLAERLYMRLFEATTNTVSAKRLNQKLLISVAQHLFVEEINLEEDVRLCAERCLSKLLVKTRYLALDREFMSTTLHVACYLYKLLIEETYLTTPIPFFAHGTNLTVLSASVHSKRSQQFSDVIFRCRELVMQGFDLSIDKMKRHFHIFLCSRDSSTSIQERTDIIRMLTSGDIRFDSNRILQNGYEDIQNIAAYSVNNTTESCRERFVKKNFSNMTRVFSECMVDAIHNMNSSLPDDNVEILTFNEEDKIKSMSLQSYDNLLWSATLAVINCDKVELKFINFICSSFMKRFNAESLKVSIKCWNWVLLQRVDLSHTLFSCLTYLWEEFIDCKIGLFNPDYRVSTFDSFSLSNYELSEQVILQLDLQDLMLKFFCAHVGSSVLDNSLNKFHFFMTIFNHTETLFWNNRCQESSFPHYCSIRFVHFGLLLHRHLSTIAGASSTIDYLSLRIYSLAILVLSGKLAIPKINEVQEQLICLMDIWDIIIVDYERFRASIPKAITIQSSSRMLDVASAISVDTACSSKEVLNKNFKSIRRTVKKFEKNQSNMSTERNNDPIKDAVPQVSDAKVNIFSIKLDYMRSTIIHLVQDSLEFLSTFLLPLSGTEVGLFKTGSMTDNEFLINRIVAISKINYIRPDAEKNWPIYAKIIEDISPISLVRISNRFKKYTICYGIMAKYIMNNPHKYVNVSGALPVFMNPLFVKNDPTPLSLGLVWRPGSIIHAFDIIASNSADSLNSLPFKSACNILKRVDMDTLIFYIPQLIQALRWDTGHIVEELIYNLCSSAQLINHQIIWNIQSNIYMDVDGNEKEPVFGDHLQRILDNLLKMLSDAKKQFFNREFNFFNLITEISGTLKPIEKSKRREVCIQELSKIVPTLGVYLPTNPNSIITGIDYDSGRPLQSAAKAPFLVTFTSLTLTTSRVEKINMSKDYEKKFEELMKSRSPIAKSAIFKVGDDVRQDVLALQFISIFKNLFDHLGLDLFVFPYKVVATGPGSGVIECIPNAKSRDQLGKETETDLYSYFLSLYGRPDSVAYENARRNFIGSMASYSVLSYLLQIKDRHNGNIMIDTDGHIIHIDFGFIFDSSPGGNIGFEPDMKITQEMMNIMGGTMDSPYFKFFTQQFIRAFLAVRQFTDGLLHITSLMLNSNLPCFRGDTIKKFRNRFFPDIFDKQAASVIEKVISNSVVNYRTTVYDLIQKAQNEIPC